MLKDNKVYEEEFNILGFTISIVKYYSDYIIICRPKEKAIEGGSQKILDAFELDSIKEYLKVERTKNTSSEFYEDAEQLLLSMSIEYKYNHRLLPKKWFKNHYFIFG